MNKSSWWKLSRKNSPTRRSKTPTAVSAEVESMEARQLPSASALFLPATGELSIDLGESDSVQIGSFNGNLTVMGSTNGGAFTAINTVGSVPAANVLSIDVLGGDEANTIDLSRVTAAAFTSLTSIVADGANGHDTIIGSPDLNDSLIGGNGNDTIQGQGGNDTLVGGDGADSISGGVGDDSINSGDGDDNVVGDDGNDSINGGNGQDTVSGGLGNDTVQAGNGQDSLQGDAGDDFLNGDGGTDTVDGGDGNDSILGGEFNDSLLGGNGNDTINGQAGNDFLNGQAGDDSLLGGAGNDNLVGQDGSDILNAEAGNDIALGNNGDDTILGGAGNDSLFGDGPDAASLESGNDSINGQSGNDTIIGGSGADTLAGSTGADVVSSTFMGNAVVQPPAPPPPPPPPPPPVVPTPTDFNPGPAVSAGGGSSLGASAVLSTGAGDGTMTLTTNGEGDITITNIDPFGSGFASSGLSSGLQGVYFRAGVTGTRTELDSTGAVMTGNGTEANSSWSQFNLDFALTQNVALFDNRFGNPAGSILTQTYTITNPGTTAANFELVRSIDSHIGSGSGRFVFPGGFELLYETQNIGTTPTNNDNWIAISGVGGTIDLADRFHVSNFSGIAGTGSFLGIENGDPLNDTVPNDTDADGFSNTSVGDPILGLRNVFDVAPGQTVTYTTHTLFGSARPDLLEAFVFVNQPPTAVNDAATSTGGLTATIDVVSNDSDPDGIVDFSTVRIESQPANGTAVSLGNGLVTYTPNAGFSGVDTFTYSVADNNGARTNIASVTLMVFLIDAAGDVILGDVEDDTLLGSFGNDTINAGGGNDLVLGSGGNDVIAGGSGNDTLDGQAGNDTLEGQGGDDLLIGGDGNDTFLLANGAGGDDFATGGEGFNQIVANGTNSNDTLVVDQNTGRIRVTRSLATITADSDMSVQGVTVNALLGNDTVNILDLSAVACPVLVVVNGGDGNDLINGVGANLGRTRLFVNGDAGNDTIVGTNGDDVINGGLGDDAVNGQAGNDSISGAQGEDVLSGGLGNDSIDGGNGADFLTGQAGDDSINGGDGNDTLRGFEGNDTLIGVTGDDLLNGMDGNDSISGGVGQDQITGGSGDDTLDGGRNNDTINGNAGNDLIHGDHGNDYISAGTESDTVSGGDGDDTIIATDGGDLLGGGDGNDQINAGAGDDTLTGGDGNDTLLGGAGNDILLGGDGDDVINGQGGTDIVAGNQGIDAIADPISEINEHFVLSAAILSLLGL